MENILDSLLFLMRIWAESVNKLILVAIRMVREFFALAMEKVNIIDCFGLLEGFIDDSNDDKMILKLKSEFEDDGHDKYSSSTPGFYSEYLLRKSVMDMEMCIKKHSTHPMTCLLEFLSTTADDGSVELLKQISSSSSDELVLLVCLVRMADSLASSLRIVPLASALDQAFEIIVFIHAKTITKSGSKHHANLNIGSLMTTDMPAEQENHEAVGNYASLGNEETVSDANVIKANGTNVTEIEIV
ncbi:hypothetical protein Syun_031030 [Stephania yunnanensis]|uniref:Uncharacterized protein n=1 Tax=Stephania yunnanensis TaxID=152371 RepID=A0AAP0DVG1_9MAGN